MAVKRDDILIKMQEYGGYVNVGKLRGDLGVSNMGDSPEYIDFRQQIKDLIKDGLLDYHDNSKKAHEAHKRAGSEAMIDNLFNSWEIRITSTGIREVRENKKVENGQSGKRGDTTFNTSGKIGRIVNVGGEGNKVIVHQEKKENPISLGADQNYNLLVDISRFLFEKLGDSYFKIFWALTGISGVGTAGSLILFNSSVHTGTSNTIFASPYLLPSIILIAILAFAIAMIGMPKKSTCPKCKKPFSIYKVNRHFVGEKKIGNEIVRNYKVFEKCSNCNFKDSYIFATREEIPDEEGEDPDEEKD